MILFLLILCIPFSIYCELVWQQTIGNISAAVELSATKVSLNQPLTLTLHLEFPSNSRVNLSELWQQNNYSTFALLSKDSQKSAQSLSVQYVLEPLVSGKSFIRMAPFAIQNTTFTPPLIPVTVDPIAQQNSSLKAEPLVQADILHPIEISRENALLFEKPSTKEEIHLQMKQRTFPFGTLLLALAFVIALPIFILFLRKQAPVLEDNSKINLLRTLRDLEHDLNAQKLEPETYQNLNLRMRQYIQDRFGINSPYLTTEEFLKEASENENIDIPNRETLKAFLKESDRVKFKGKMPTFQDLDVSLKLVHKLIRNS